MWCALRRAPPARSSTRTAPRRLGGAPLPWSPRRRPRQAQRPVGRPAPSESSGSQEVHYSGDHQRVVCIFDLLERGDEVIQRGGEARRCRFPLPARSHRCPLATCHHGSHALSSSGALGTRSAPQTRHHEVHAIRCKRWCSVPVDVPLALQCRGDQPSRRPRTTPGQQHGLHGCVASCGLLIATAFSHCRCPSRQSFPSGAGVQHALPLDDSRGEHGALRAIPPRISWPPAAQTIDGHDGFARGGARPDATEHGATWRGRRRRRLNSDQAIYGASRARRMPE
jgi:hypothetical protein